MPGDFVIVVCFEDETRERFVMVRHRDRGWELPGGHVEGEESATAAAQREFHEETGRRLVDPRKVHRRQHGGAVGTTFEARLGPAEEDRGEDDQIVDWRLVHRLDDVAPLAFPDDPYDEIGDAIGRPLR